MGEFAKAFEQRWMAEGKAEGIVEATLSSIKSLMETLGLPLDKAMVALKIPEADRPQYMQLLEKQ